MTTTLDIIKHAIRRAVFGPRELITDMEARFSRGRDSQPATDRFMRSQLRVTEFLPVEIDDGERSIPRDQVGNSRFPRSKLGELVGAFEGSWGKALIGFLSELMPYRAHYRALSALAADWDPDDNQGRLAHDAVFEGVGKYWTLRNSYSNWESLGRPTDRQTAVIRAWEQLERRKEWFEGQRARELDEEERVAEVNRLFRVLNTAACQVGGLMMVASVALESETSRDAVPGLSERLVAALNQGLEADRRYWMFDPRGTKPLNQISEMNTPMAIHFRYFFLELLGTNEARQSLEDEDNTAVASLLPNARSTYLSQLEQQQLTALQKTATDLTPAEAERRANEAARSSLEEALSEWFEIDAGALAEWHEERSQLGVADEDDEYDEAE